MFDQAHADQEKADRRAKAEAREVAEEEEEEQADESDHGNEIMLPKAPLTKTQRRRMRQRQSALKQKQPRIGVVTDLKDAASGSTALRARVGPPPIHPPVTVGLLPSNLAPALPRPTMPPPTSLPPPLRSSPWTPMPTVGRCPIGRTQHQLEQGSGERQWASGSRRTRRDLDGGNGHEW